MIACGILVVVRQGYRVQWVGAETYFGGKAANRIKVFVVVCKLWGNRLKNT